MTVAARVRRGQGGGHLADQEPRPRTGPRRHPRERHLPGFLWTRAWEGLATGMKISVPQYADRSPRDIFLEVVKNGVPLRREQTPEDIGNLATFLSSAGGRNITGQAIAVDGGITLR